MSEPTPDVVRAYYAALCADYGATVVPKASSALMGAVGAFLGAIGIVDRAAFASRFVTTLGRTVYVPFVPGEPSADWSLWSQIEVLAHECQHIRQHDDRGLRFERDYLMSTAKRAHLEAEAYAVNAALHHWRHGVIEGWWPTHTAGLLRFYGCTDADVLVAERHLRMIASSVRAGVVVSHAARTAIVWLDEHAPKLRHPAVASRARS